jgi:hypothetical protein
MELLDQEIEEVNKCIQSKTPHYGPEDIDVLVDSRKYFLEHEKLDTRAYYVCRNWLKNSVNELYPADVSEACVRNTVPELKDVGFVYMLVKFAESRFDTIAKFLELVDDQLQERGYHSQGRHRKVLDVVIDSMWHYCWDLAEAEVLYKEMNVIPEHDPEYVSKMFQIIERMEAINNGTSNSTGNA